MLMMLNIRRVERPASRARRVCDCTSQATEEPWPFRWRRSFSRLRHGRFRTSCLLHDIQRNCRFPGDAEEFCTPAREVDHELALDGAAVVDPNHGRSPILLVDDTHLGSKRQGPVAGRKALGIVAFAARRVSGQLIPNRRTPSDELLG